MILFNPVVQVLTLAYLDWFQPALGAILQTICGVTGNDSIVVGLATVDNNAVGSTMTCRRFPEEPLG